MTFLTIEIAKLLDKYSIDFIFFKGVALSLQTTSSFFIKEEVVMIWI